MKLALLISVSLSVLVLVQVVPIVQSEGPLFAPYFDVTLDKPNLYEYSNKTAQKDFTLAFALGGTSGCEPVWGGKLALDDPAVLEPIRKVQSLGGQMVIATGGAVGPYLEHVCTSADALAAAYVKVLETVDTTHLDVDIEAPIDKDRVNIALAKVQKLRPGTTVSYTVMIQGEDYGMTPQLGVDVLENAVKHGVDVGLVNAMTMEFPGKSKDWGDSVINAAQATLKQMKVIWKGKGKTESELRRMLGVTPMIGRNFNGKVFETSHARKLVDWANEYKIGYLSFWSIGRDNGDCPGSLSPYCSGTAQGPEEFTKIFQGFQPGPPEIVTTTTFDPTAPTTTTSSTPSTTPSTECEGDGIGGIQCSSRFWSCSLDNNKWTQHWFTCSDGLVYDPTIKACNWADSAGC